MVCDDNLIILILSARVDADCFSLYFCYGAFFTYDFKRTVAYLSPHTRVQVVALRGVTRD